MPTITNREYQQRMSNLQAQVAASELDALLVTARDSIFYLTGLVYEPLERPFFMVVRRDRSPVFLVPLLEGGHLERLAKTGIVTDREFIVTYRELPAPPGQGWPERLHEVLETAQHVGVEASLARGVSAMLDNYTLHTSPLVDDLRVVKSAAEIEMIRRAAGYADLGVKRLLAASYFGSSVAEGFVETRSVTKRIIREVGDFDPLLTKVLMATWPAPLSAEPHSIPKLEDRLREGPHIALVLTGVKGYSGESERTYFTSPPKRDERHRFGTMMKARQLALEMMAPGVRCGDVDARVRQFLAKKDFGERLLHCTGHGIGISYHAEAPWLAEGSDDVLAPGMVMSVEPGLYFTGVGGYRHSDTVLITDGGVELLTHHPTDIDKLTVTSWKPRRRFVVQPLLFRSLGLRSIGSRRTETALALACDRDESMSGGPR